jgi:hypothetical protein
MSSELTLLEYPSTLMANPLSTNFISFMSASTAVHEEPHSDPNEDSFFKKRTCSEAELNAEPRTQGETPDPKPAKKR